MLVKRTSISWLMLTLLSKNRAAKCLLGGGSEQLGLHGLVLRPDRPQQDFGAVGELPGHDVARGVGRDHEMRVLGLALEHVSVDDDPRVDGARLAVGDHKRVDVDLGDLGEVDAMLESTESSSSSSPMSGGTTPRRGDWMALKDAGLLHHPARKRLVEWRQRDREVRESLGTDAAGPEEDHGAELRILLHAEDQS